MRLLIKLVIYTVAVWAAVQIVDGLSIQGEGWTFAAVAAVVGLINAVVKPIAKVLSFPLVIATLGLFLLILNALLLQLAIWLSSELGLGIDSTGFGATFLGALVISIVVWAGEALTRTGD